MRTPPLSKNLEPHLQSLPPEEAIPYLLRSLHHSLRQVVEAKLRRETVGMSLAHLAILFTLDAEPGLTGAELARRSFVTAQTMNTTLRRMERDAQIERRPHPARPRADSWFLTKKGLSQLKPAKVIGKEIWRKMLSPLKASEIAQLKKVLQQCIRSLDGEPVKDPASPPVGRARRRPV